jgi:Atypical PilZ domain, cyclic di-GMP receptor
MSETMSQLLRMLSMSEIEALGESVFCDDEIGLTWKHVERLPDEAVMNRLSTRNETVLRALAMIEEHDQTRSDESERAELHRLEGKLDLALELLAEVVGERHASTPTYPVRFNARGLCWECPEAVPVGALLSMECYVLPPWPLPLKVHVRIQAVEPRGRKWWVCGRIEGLFGGAKEWLGKLVFRRHRRTVALQRQRG